MTGARWPAVALTLLALGGCRSCLDLDGRAYPCVMDSGLPNECAAQWRCGLETSGIARCHPIGKPGPYVCASDEACEGWHCGASGVCYDRTDAGAIACRADLLDCAPGWRCNALSGSCQNTAVGASYPCDDDGDCEQQWRCGLGGVCLDATAEGLRPPVKGLAATRLTPAWTFDGGVEAFSAGRASGAYALLSAGTLHLRDGVYQPRPAPPGTQGATLAGGRAFAATGSGVLRATASGFEPFAPLADAQLRSASDGRLVAWSGADVVLAAAGADAGAAAVAPGPLLFADFVPDVASPTPWLWTVTSSGLFVSPPDAGALAFVPVALPGLRSSCAGAGTDAPLSVQPALRGAVVVVEVQPADGGVAVLDVYDHTPGQSGAACTDQGLGFVSRCEACPAGARLQVRNDEGGPSFSIACLGPGLQRSEHRVKPVGLGCTRTAVKTFAARTSAEPAAWAWVTPDGTVFHDDRPVTPSTAAIAAGPATDLRLYDKLPNAFDRAYFADEGAAFAAPAGDLAQFCAAVPGAPWVVGTTADRGVSVFPLTRGAEPPRGVLDGTVAYGGPDAGGTACFEDGQPLFHAALGPTRDGGELLVVGGEDRVWAIETPKLLTDAGTVVRVGVRSVPAVAGRFQDLAMVDPRKLEGTDYAVGYGLVSSRLFRIRARSATSWVNEELPLPDGEPIALWADGAHARVGFADGRVLSAASRVALAGPTPTRVDAFASLCGEGFALAGGTLYRLVASDAGAVGTWAPVDLGPARLPPSSGARLSRGDRAVFVSASNGVVARVAVPSCQ